MSSLDQIRETASRLAGRRFTCVVDLDLETRSEADLKKVGAEMYARHPSTEIMCASWSVDDQPIDRWKEDDVLSLVEATPFFSDPNTLYIFHNAEFEPKILLHCAGIHIDPEQLVDSAAIARFNNLPGALDPLGQFFGMPKDMDGNRVMLKLSKPRRPSKDNTDLFWRRDTKPEDFNILDKYCDRDVEVSLHATKKMPFLSDFEWRTYRATYRMNARGFPIDRAAAKALWKIVIDTRKRMTDAIFEEHGFTLTQPAKVAEFLETLSCDKATLRDLLKDPDLDPAKRRVAKARQLFAKTSVDKIAKMISHSAATGSVHGGVIYGGAERTVRFSGAGVQPQNFPRGMGTKQDTVFLALIAEVFEFVYGGEELSTIADVIRGLIRRPDGGLLNVGDYSQIEARLLAWMVGDELLLSVFRRGGDPYKMMASKIYNKPEETITGAERFMGKQTVLGCGYGLGEFGFMSMLDITYDVQITKEESGGLVSAYRKSAPKVVAFWKRLDKALIVAANDVGVEKVIQKGKLSICFTDDETFFLRLPSGRQLWYYQVERKGTAKGVDWSCYGKLKSGAGYGRVKIYGGALTGHIIQSTARDVIADAMVRLDDLNHALILTVHDELVSLDDDDFDEFRDVMEVPPAWLIDFPLAVDAFSTERYRK
jgi:DNA polymerase